MASGRAAASSSAALLLFAAGLPTTGRRRDVGPGGAQGPGGPAAPPKTRDIDEPPHRIRASVDTAAACTFRPSTRGPVGASEVEEGDGGVGDVQLRMFAGQLGVRNDDLRAAASDPEPPSPQRNDQAGARPAVHGEDQRPGSRDAPRGPRPTALRRPPGPRRGRGGASPTVQGRDRDAGPRSAARSRSGGRWPPAVPRRGTARAPRWPVPPGRPGGRIPAPAPGCSAASSRRNPFPRRRLDPTLGAAPRLPGCAGEIVPMWT